MKERIIKVRNKAGIHCRPSSMILSTIQQKYPMHTFIIEKDGEEVELNSILNLISLGLACETEACLSVSGPDEDKAIDEIGDLFEYEFDFPPK
ncbi:MAG: HPr family phosphocarrier protein [Lentisphaeria bacterium]|nr:HPr family phosphocarrier protein [Lentisphaeria bacterium]